MKKFLERLSSAAVVLGLLATIVKLWLAYAAGRPTELLVTIVAVAAVACTLLDFLSKHFPE